MGKFKITCFCSACNSPKGSRQTASGANATAGVTVAVHPSLYEKNKRIHIEGIGDRLIQDKHGNSTNVIDVYVGECNTCQCSRHPYSGRVCEVSGL
jgi:3D (Asp-Asp-Asp) domain-containing protein